MEFQDHFSGRAAIYSQFRPTYPDALFDWLSGLVKSHEVVWDCATGSGQAAVGLAKHFDRVIATDASDKQIAMAAPHPSIDYRVATASESGLAPESVDMVTVAQAIHWFDRNRFYDEAQRVMRPDAAIVVWAYGDPVLDDSELDAIVHAYNRGTIESYWRPERDLILEGLRTISFPFREVTAPSFVLEREWTLFELAGYLRTWSATAAYAAAHGFDPVSAVEEELRASWGDGRHPVRWPLYVRAGYKLDPH
jgi:SAM-dependent methyltransferase